MRLVSHLNKADDETLKVKRAWKHERVTDPFPDTQKGQALFHIININKLEHRSLVRPNLSH